MFASVANATIEMPAADWNAPRPNHVTHTAIRPGPQMDSLRPARASISACRMASRTSFSDLPSERARSRAYSIAVSTCNALERAASRSRYSLRVMPASRANCVCDFGSVETSVRNISAPTTTHMPVNENASNPEITANVDARGLPTTHMHSSNTPDSDSARFVRSVSPFSNVVHRWRLIAPHGGIAAMNGTMQNRIHDGTRAVMQEVNAVAATIHTRIVGIETWRWPNLSTSLPSTGLARASAIACTAVNAPASE